jgi:hypothetical protein
MHDKIVIQPSIAMNVLKTKRFKIKVMYYEDLEVPESKVYQYLKAKYINKEMTS